MIEAHVGLPGSGKSLHGVARLLKEKSKGRQTLANFHSQTGKWEFALWADMAEAGNCFVVIDEAHMWFSARTWTKTQQGELSVFQQHRKEGIDLVWIAQHESRVDVAVRELTAFIWRHKKMGQFVIASQVTPEEPKKILKRKVVRISPYLYQHYFTEERIGFRDGEGYKFGGGTAYRRAAAGPGPELDEAYRLKPNFFRIEFPDRVVYHPADAPLLADLVSCALNEWARSEAPRGAGDLVRGIYRSSDGRMHELDHGGAVLPVAERLDLLGQTKALYLEVLSSRSPQGSGSAGTGTGVKPVAVPGMARAQAVAEQGLRKVIGLAKDFNRGERSKEAS